MTNVVTPNLASDVLTIARNTTGRVDANDPLFTDAIMLNYLNNFLQNEFGAETRLFDHQTFWTFSIDQNSTDPYPVNLDALGYMTIGSDAWVDGFELFWYQDPLQFYRLWPETQTYQPSRPTYVLYYNNGLVFRNPPDKSYTVKIQAYKIDGLLNLGSNIPVAYLNRFLAYGMSLDIFADYGEMDKYAEIFPVYKRYRGQVLARTHSQFISQRTTPNF